METPIDDALFADLPSKKYSTIAVDPPWDYRDRLGGNRGTNGFGPSINQAKSGMYPGVRAAANHYDTLPTEQIARLPVADMAEPNAHIYIWTTNAFMQEAHDLAVAWGFVPKTIVTWVKTKKGVSEPAAPEDCAFGMGFYYRNMTEHAIFAVRGRLAPLSHSERNIVFAPVGQHSAKPDAAYDLFARLSPGPRVDLFARTERAGWDVWGNQAPEGQK